MRKGVVSNEMHRGVENKCRSKDSQTAAESMSRQETT